MMSKDDTSPGRVEKFVKRRRRSDDVRLTIQYLQSKRYLGVKKLLGRGTYGDVFMMHDPIRNSDVAVKIITSENIAEIEYQMWPKLHHPNIVPVIDVITIMPTKVVCFFMPVQRKSLHDLLYDKRFLFRDDSLDYMKIWLSQTLCALDYLDSHNLCHLDIKVDNILISNEYRAMLCDFSFLNFQSEDLKRYDLGLPYIYRPPEACQTLGTDISIDGRAYDMWGFGIMVLEIFTHFVLATNIDDCNNWIKEIYPTLFGILQEKEFYNLMVTTFRGCDISLIEAKLALDFIHSFLMAKPLERSVAVEALQHQFLNKGMHLVSYTDPIWTDEVYSKSVGLPSVKSWKKKSFCLVDGKMHEGEDREEYDDNSDEYLTMSESDDDTKDSNSINEYMNTLSEKDQSSPGSTEEEQSHSDENLIEETFFNKNPESSTKFDFSQMGDVSAIKKEERNLHSSKSEQNPCILSNDWEKNNNRNENNEYSISQSDSKIAQKKIKKRCALSKLSRLHRYPMKAKISHLCSLGYKSPSSHRPLQNESNSTTVLQKLHYKKFSKVGSNGRYTFYRIHKKNGIVSSIEKHTNSESESLKTDTNETCIVKADSKLSECTDKLKASEPRKYYHTVGNNNVEPDLSEENRNFATGDAFSTRIGDLIDLDDINIPSRSLEVVVPASKVESIISEDDESIQSADIMKSVNKTLGQLNQINDILQRVLICENCNAKRKQIDQGNLENGKTEIRPDSMPTDLLDSSKEENEVHFDGSTNMNANLNICRHEIIDKHNDIPLDIMNSENVNLIIKSPAMQKEIHDEKEREGSPERYEESNSVKRRSG